MTWMNKYDVNFFCPFGPLAVNVLNAKRNINPSLALDWDRYQKSPFKCWNGCLKSINRFWGDKYGLFRLTSRIDTIPKLLSARHFFRCTWNLILVNFPIKYYHISSLDFIMSIPVGILRGKKLLMEVSYKVLCTLHHSSWNCANVEVVSVEAKVL